MINFIIYEDNVKFREEYMNIIHKVMGKNNNQYKIHTFSEYNSKVESIITEQIGKKIYILDIEVPGKSGIDLARDIRNSNDWNSQIIIATSHAEMKNGNFRSKILMLDFISKFDDLDNTLQRTLTLAHGIVETHSSFNFQQNGDIYQIPYNDILYIEKEQDSNISTIITRNKQIQVRQNISTIMDDLSRDTRFLRVHRSCIVNLYNIRKVNLNDNVIFFKYNKKTNLLSRNFKKELKEKLLYLDLEEDEGKKDKKKKSRSMKAKEKKEKVEE